MKTTNRESIEKIFTEALAIPSFTNTETEQGIEAYLDQRIGQIPISRNIWTILGAIRCHRITCVGRSIGPWLIRARKNSYPFPPP